MGALQGVARRQQLTHCLAPVVEIQRQEREESEHGSGGQLNRAHVVHDFRRVREQHDLPAGADQRPAMGDVGLLGVWGRAGQVEQVGAAADLAVIRDRQRRRGGRVGWQRAGFALACLAGGKYLRGLVAPVRY